MVEVQGLEQEVDPIIGTLGKAGPAPRFTIPSVPYRHRVEGLSAWVKVRGGVYLFLPSLSALNVLAGLREAVSKHSREASPSRNAANALADAENANR